MDSQDNSGENGRLEQALETIEPNRREAMRKIVAGAAFVAPVVASFAINGMTVGPAMAVPSNMS